LIATLLVSAAGLGQAAISSVARPSLRWPPAMPCTACCRATTASHKLRLAEDGAPADSKPVKAGKGKKKGDASGKGESKGGKPAQQPG